MLRGKWLLPVLTPMLAAAAPASEENRDDVRCLIISMQLVSAENTEMRAVGMVASQYFLGRIDGRNPTLDLEAELEREARGMTEASRKALFTSCGAQMEKRGAEVVAIGERLQKKGL